MTLYLFLKGLTYFYTSLALFSIFSMVVRPHGKLYAEVTEPVTYVVMYLQVWYVNYVSLSILLLSIVVYFVRQEWLRGGCVMYRGFGHTACNALFRADCMNV